MTVVDKIRNHLESKLHHPIEDRHIIQMVNIASMMKNLGRTINIIELYKAVSSFTTEKELEEWFSDNVIGSDINKEIAEAAKYDPIRTSLEPEKITIDQAKRIINGKLPVERITDYEIAVKEVESQIFRQLKNTYIQRRGQYLSNGELDRALSINEYSKLETEAAKLLDSNPDIRQLERNNTNNKATALLLNDKAVDFKYKIETLKEFICNKFRVTPESFDIWFDLVYNENLENFSTSGDLKQIMDKNNRVNLIVKYQDFLIKSDIPKDQPVYVSEFIKAIDKEEEEKLEISKRQHGSEMFDAMVDLINKKSMRDMGIIPDNTVTNGPNGIKNVNTGQITKVVQRIKARR